MRDKNRIPEIISTLERIWIDNPDFRLGQLLMAAIRPKDPCPDVFYKEDNKILEGLLEFEAKSKKQ